MASYRSVPPVGPLWALRVCADRGLSRREGTIYTHNDPGQDDIPAVSRPFLAEVNMVSAGTPRQNYHYAGSEFNRLTL